MTDRAAQPSAHTLPCDCGYKHCDGTTQLNGLRFTCSQGQYTYERFVDDFPVYAAAPELLEALEALVLLRSSTATSELWVAVWDRAEAVIAKVRIPHD